jgi:hypothetical protein
MVKIRSRRGGIMAKIPCEIDFGEEKNELGFVTECTYAICNRCGHETMSFGTHADSIARCLARMQEECPEEESNLYYDEDQEDG